jgi:hypothetical protein
MVVRPYFTEQKQVLPFDKVIELERIDDWTFRSIVKAYSPTAGENGTYGGHVFAQAAWAAAQTVDEGFLIHVCPTTSLTHVTNGTSRISQAGSYWAENPMSTIHIECARSEMATITARETSRSARWLLMATCSHAPALSRGRKARHSTFKST